MQGNAKLLAVLPVHEGEDEDPTGEETQEGNDAIDSVQPGVMETQLDENLSHRDERGAELCGEQAADEEITKSPSEEQSDGHEDEKQHQVMEDQHPVLTEESLHCLKGVAAE